MHAQQQRACVTVCVCGCGEGRREKRKKKKLRPDAATVVWVNERLLQRSSNCVAFLSFATLFVVTVCARVCMCWNRESFERRQLHKNVQTFCKQYNAMNPYTNASIQRLAYRARNKKNVRFTLSTEYIHINKNSNSMLHNRSNIATW